MPIVRTFVGTAAVIVLPFRHRTAQTCDKEVEPFHLMLLWLLIAMNGCLPAGFQAVIIIRRSVGLFLILSITWCNWSTPAPVYSPSWLV